MSFISQEEFNSRLESAYKDELDYEQYYLNDENTSETGEKLERFIRENVSDFNNDDYDNMPNESDIKLRKLYRKTQKLDKVQRRKANRTINRQKRRAVKKFRNEYTRMEEESDRLQQIEDQRQEDLRKKIKSFHKENLLKINNGDYSIQFSQIYDDKKHNVIIYLYKKFLTKKLEINEIPEKIGYTEYKDYNGYIGYLSDILKELRMRSDNLYYTFKELYKINIDDDDELFPDTILNISFHVLDDIIYDNTNISIESKNDGYYTTLVKGNTYESLESDLNYIYNNKEYYSRNNDYYKNIINYYESYKLSLMNSMKTFI